MDPNNIPIKWFDCLLLVVILLGANRGRKHGMSVECTACLQWVAIIFTCAFLYKPLGDMLAQSSPMSHLFCYIAMYIVVAMLTKIAFTFIKKGTGGKLIGSDIFGRGEFYLGMVAGAVRFTCILIAAMALLNARLYTPQEVNAAQAFQTDMYGSTFFPELYTVQAEVFKSSYSGSFFKKYCEFMLIKPTVPEHKGVQRRKDDLP